MGKLAVAPNRRIRTRLAVLGSGVAATNTLIASGGTVTISSSTVSHTYTASGSFLVYQAGIATAVNVTGGGSSGPSAGSLAIGSYPIVVGGGGSVVVQYPTDGLLAGLYATGGTIAIDGNYIRHTFTAGGTFALALSGLLATEYLVVAGGGGGLRSGGGAGGMRSGTSNIVASATVTIGTGGAGGSGTAGAPSASNDGGASSLGAISVTVGGGGGACDNGTDPSAVGRNGGSGGGGSTRGTGTTYAGGTATGGEGNNGGTNNGFPNVSPFPSGGGGGKGAVGGNAAAANAGGIGGAGAEWPASSGTFYAGGGGGSVFGGTNSGGTGGAGGGGAGGGNTTDGAVGTANTGGGGGGGGNGRSGGAGGSGIVVVRYLPGAFQPGHPLGLGSDLWAWYDPTQGVTGGATVTQWNDQSANARHVTPGAAGSPSSGTRTVNSINVIDFDGVNDGLGVTSGASFGMTNFTVIVLGQQDNTTAGAGLINNYLNSAGHDYDNVNSMAFGCGNSGLGRQAQYDQNSGAAIFNGSMPTPLAVWSVRKAGTAVVMQKNGTQVATATITATGTADRMSMGWRAKEVSNYLDGCLGDVIEVNTNLSDALWALVTTWMRVRWAQ